MKNPANAGFTQDWVKSGSIARLHDRDDAETWKGWRRTVYRFAPLFMAANSGLYIFYLGLRIYCIIMAQRAEGMVFIAAWVFVAIELSVAVPSLMQNGWTMLALKKRGRPKLRLVGGEVPTVDVFVTCCGEDDELVLDTVRAACDQDYPANRFRVIILDDGKSASLKKGAEELASSSYPNLYYVAREKIPGKPHHFKAGNLNNGLDYTLGLPDGAGEYMAALDADMVRFSFDSRISPTIIKANLHD